MCGVWTESVTPVLLSGLLMGTCALVLFLWGWYYFTMNKFTYNIQVNRLRQSRGRHPSLWPLAFCVPLWSVRFAVHRACSLLCCIPCSRSRRSHVASAAEGLLVSDCSTFAAPLHVNDPRDRLRYPAQRRSEHAQQDVGHVCLVSLCDL
jgi:hypothetical protein